MGAWVPPPNKAAAIKKFRADQAAAMLSLPVSMINAVPNNAVEDNEGNVCVDGAGSNSTQMQEGG